MSSVGHTSTRLRRGQAIERWIGLGPYYAMMPRAFAEAQIRRFTDYGDAVLDPFCGRGTVPFVAASLGRRYTGIEIFDVGWVFASAKTSPAPRDLVEKRLRDMSMLSATEIVDSDFFRYAYAPDVLKFLCASREHLNWKTDSVDRTLMALILVSLHDKIGNGFSNQMRQTKAVDPAYAIAWWKANNMLTPPDIDPVALIQRKINWRYAKGVPILQPGRILSGDCTQILGTSEVHGKHRLLLTSPPYYGVTNYCVDQWMRQWMLGGAPTTERNSHPFLNRFTNREVYRSLIETMLTKSSKLLTDDATLVIRTDAREFTLTCTIEAIRKAFPAKKIFKRMAPLKGKSQTALFGSKTEPPGEVDIFVH